MDPATLSIITALASGFFVNFTTPILKEFFSKVFKLKPSLEEALKQAKTTTDFERIFREAVGVIDATAGTGIIEVDHAFLQALRGIRFDHENGSVTIQGSTVRSEILETGGSGSGQTLISDSSLQSQGTRMDVGAEAQIKIMGNAKIRQT